MKRKILSILLIIFMLSASVITIPVSAKILNEGDHSWVFDNETFTSGGVIEEDAVYETVDEYLSVHYVGYADLEKSDITTLWLADDAGGIGSYSIKDLSGIYDFPNLTQLCLWYIDNETTQAALEALDFSRLTNIEKLYIEGTKINNLELGELTNLKFLHIENGMRIAESLNDYYINMDFSNMTQLEHFLYNILLDYEMGSHQMFAEEVAECIKAPDAFEVWKELDYGTDEYADVSVTYSLIEKLNLVVTTDKTNYKFKEEVACNVSWDKPMEMTDFRLTYDPTKLEFVSVDIEEDFYDVFEGYNSEDMVISVAWISLDEVGINEINFTFKTLAEGETELKFEPWDFATGDLDNQFIFDGSKKNITVGTDGIKDTAQIQIDLTNIDGEDFDLISGLTLTNNKVTLQDLVDLDAFDDDITVKAYRMDTTTLIPEEIEIDATEGLGTGAKIRLYKGQEFVRELDVIVYGDVSGDGEITSLDALTLIRAENNKLPYGYDWSTLKCSAGMVFTGHQDVHGPSAIDALAIIKHLNGKYEITQNY